MNGRKEVEDLMVVLRGMKIGGGGGGSLFPSNTHICMHVCVGVHRNMHVHTYCLSKGDLFVVSLAPRICSSTGDPAPRKL